MSTSTCPDGTREVYGLSSQGLSGPRCIKLQRYRLSRDPEGTALLMQDFRELRLPSTIADQAAACELEGKHAGQDLSAAKYIWDSQRDRLAYTGNPVNYWQAQLAKEERILQKTKQRVAELKARIRKAS